MNWGWAYDGVNSSIPRNTGPECVQYLSPTRHIIESAVLVPLAIVIFRYGLSKLPPIHANYDGTDRILFGKQLLLITMSALLGLEMGFKLCTRTAIYILNPCHVTSMLQVYLLAAKPSKLTTTLFRIHINYLNGPLLAFLFPEHDSRQITFELPTYYVQHGLMFVIPMYLLRHGGPYAAEKFADLSYNIVAYGIFLFYHFGFLEFFAVGAHVNLNHMICPAILDPFQGANYRLNACLHQAILCPLVSKLFAYIVTPGSDVDTEKRIQSRDANNVIAGIDLIRKFDSNHTKIQNDINNTQIKARIKMDVMLSHDNGDIVDGDEKRINNGCDIGNLLEDASIPCSNGSNKKLE